MPTPTQSLCWQCARSAGGAGCPWVDKQQPVDGWEARGKYTQYAHGVGDKRMVRLTTVTTCPLFAAEGEIEIGRPERQPKQHSSAASLCRTSWGAYR